MQIRHRERAMGVDARLQAFLDWWIVNGHFDLTVCQDGGVRFDQLKQQQYFASGASNARTLAETPHGRAGALDVAPFIQGYVPWANKALFLVLGEAAEAQGLVWGGRFMDRKTGKPKPDADHIQVPDWRTLPFPPQLSKGVT